MMQGFVAEEVFKLKNRVFNRQYIIHLLQIGIIVMLGFPGLIFTVKGYNARSFLFPLSLTLVILFVWSVFSWYLMTGSVFNPYTLFLTATFLFNGSAALLFLFGKDFSETLGSNFSAETLSKTLYLVAFSMAAFHYGGILGQFSRKDGLILSDRNIDYEIDLQETSIRIVGLLMIGISIIPFYFFIKDNMVVVYKRGYFGLFEREAATGFGAWSNVLSGFILTGIYYLFLGGRKRNSYKYISATLLILYIILHLFIGSRSRALLPGIIFLWLWYRYVSKSRKKILIIVIIVLLIMLFLITPLIKIMRNVPGEMRNTISIYLEGLRKIREPIVTPLAELGGTLRTVAYTLDYVPHERKYDYGESYLYALLTVVPNFFWNIHPTIKRGTYADWLIEKVNPYTAAKGGGYGFSYIAEAYGNFGWIGGLIVMLLIGYLIAKLNNKLENEINILFVGFYASFLHQLLFFTRGESALLVRAIIWYSVFPYTIAYFIYRKLMFSRNS